MEKSSRQNMASGGKGSKRVQHQKEIEITYIWDSFCHRASQLSREFHCIEADFKDVVNQGKQGTQWEGGHKQGQKAKLED